MGKVHVQNIEKVQHLKKKVVKILKKYDICKKVVKILKSTTFKKSGQDIEKVHLIKMVSQQTY